MTLTEITYAVGRGKALFIVTPIFFSAFANCAFGLMIRTSLVLQYERTLPLKRHVHLEAKQT